MVIADELVIAVRLVAATTESRRRQSLASRLANLFIPQADWDAKSRRMSTS
jgi:hypothetical protein